MATASDPTRVVLVRHGESRAFVDGVVGGHLGCTGLSSRGRRQAEALRDRLAASPEYQPAVLVSSVLRRAEETATVLWPVFGTEEFERSCDLCELHTGEADGLTFLEANQRYSQTFSSLFESSVPGAESRADFIVRAASRLSWLASHYRGSTVVIVCHGGVIAASFVAFGNQPLEPSFDLHIDNASMTEWVAEPGKGRSRWKLVRLNDTAHLRAPYCGWG